MMLFEGNAWFYWSFQTTVVQTCQTAPVFLEARFGVRAPSGGLIVKSK